MPNIVALKLSYSLMEGHKDEGNILALDQLALQQQISANFLFQAISNYKKTPSERKTLHFITKKWLHMQMLWREFRLRDKQIRRRGHKDARLLEHGYFQQELFQLVHERYMLVRGFLSRDKRNLLAGQPATRP
ncbi:uncharacterized protein LOC6549066 [Drosophila erecta]|uniref:Uncharacterized protein n=1 Tax=Drosophila erecta TaxID=7220 RepID=B3NM30_DROER|nr:uncharacterized protein LOC6549066 [Drosophila erecta]EDV54566.1 uncharacterized protein Dere_GG21580 [Drosophila erecta]